MSDYTPQELLVHIFSRLPVKSLLRLRSVPKHWRFVISSSDFIDAHFTISSKRPSFMLSRPSGNRPHIEALEQLTIDSDDTSVVDYVELDYPLPQLGLVQYGQMIVGDCNGLLCLSDERNILLWNPSIRRYFTLLLSSLTMNCFKSYIFFGFDLKAKDFKVVRMCYLLDFENTQEMLDVRTEVYALSIGRWKSVSSPVFPSPGFNLLSSGQVYINGACLHIVFKSSSGGRHVLLSFDLGDEVFQLMDIPKGVSCSTHGSKLGIRLLHNMVSLFQVQDEGYPSTLSLWVMREFGVVESWTKQYSFEFEGQLDPLLMQQYYGCYYVESLALLSGSRWNGEARPLRALSVLSTSLSKGEGTDGDAIRTEAANKSVVLSITSVCGNIVEFLLVKINF